MKKTYLIIKESRWQSLDMYESDYEGSNLIFKSNSFEKAKKYFEKLREEFIEKDAADKKRCFRSIIYRGGDEYNFTIYYPNAIANSYYILKECNDD